MADARRPRVFFSTLGSRGDVHPYVAVARALAKRGIHSTIGTGEEHRATIENANLPADPNRLTSDANTIAEKSRVGTIAFALIPPSKKDFEGTGVTMDMVMHATKGGEFILHQIVLPWLERTHAATLAAARGHDLVVGHPLAFVAPLVAEQLDVPYVYSVLQPMTLYSAYDPPVLPPMPWLDALRRLGPGPYLALFELGKFVTRHWARPLRQLRRTLALPDDPRHPIMGGLFSRRLNLAMFSPLLASHQPDWPDNSLVTGPCLFDDPHAATAPAELEAFIAAAPDERHRPILFTLGSAAVEVSLDGPRFFQHALSAARALGRRCILLAGKRAMRESGTPDDAPVPACKLIDENALMVTYAPFSRVMPRCSAVVHQCGAGTTAEVMRAGVPHVCVPFAHDQPDHAARLNRLGVALTVPRRRVSAASLAAALARVLDPRAGHAARAAALGSIARRENGAERAADAIERVLA